MSEPDRAATIAGQLLSLTAAACRRSAEDPFGNPMMSVALVISRRIDQGEITLDDLQAVVRHLRDAAFADRARRLDAYVGGTADAHETLAEIARRLIRPDPDDSPVPLARFRTAVERIRFAAVFTAHPTFALPRNVLASLAEAASGRSTAAHLSHRPGTPTLETEFVQAAAAIAAGRDAIDRFTAALLGAARDCWPDRWTSLMPRPIILTSWVGYDTDGRTDIDWYDTLRLRLRMKLMQIERLSAQLAPIAAAAEIAKTLAAARTVVKRQIEVTPDSAAPEAVAAFANALIRHKAVALVTPEPLLGPFAEAIAAAPEADKLVLAVARAGLVAHGMSLAHTHVRLNASQLHNVVRQRLGITDAPEDPARRRVLLTKINAALADVTPVPIDFGTLLSEPASAARLMMTVAQIVKHIDGAAPVRFLIAETESGYTLLAALWLARRFGIEQHIEISPLFETAEALENGAQVLEEALRSPHWRAYLQATGRLSLQFGYSDSGRYIGQLAASYLIERLRMKIAALLERYEISGIEVILFDTHGESIGRGAHPNSLAARLKYLSPTASRQALAKAGIAVREESAFQGGDGYLFFGTPELASATIARIAEHAFPAPAPASADPVYAEPDFAADFFAAIGAGMRELVADRGYAALLGALGPALLDKTGSRPSARQSDGAAGPAIIQHPRELRAIPNNAILQQLGWCANTLHGLGAAVARHPETFLELLETSPRFRRALDLAEHALKHSDLHVLRAQIAIFDPTTWLDRAHHSRFPPGRRAALVAVARNVDRLDLSARAQAMFRRIQADHLALRGVWTEAPGMAPREMLLHALRLTMINRIWLLETEIPDFSPRHGVTRQMMSARILRLDVPATVDLLERIFPAGADPGADLDYAEPRAPRATGAYKREHDEIFTPMRVMFALIREIGTAISHEVGAFG